MQPSVDPFHAVANAESVARTRRERRPLEILFGGRQGESPSPPAFAPSLWLRDPSEAKVSLSPNLGDLTGGERS